MSLSGTGMQKIQKLGSYKLEAQGSRKHEGEWPNKPGSQHQAWHNTLTPFQKSEEIQWLYKDQRVIKDHNRTTCSSSTTTTTATTTAMANLTNFV